MTEPEVTAEKMIKYRSKTQNDRTTIPKTKTKQPKTKPKKE